MSFTLLLALESQGCVRGGHKRVHRSLRAGLQVMVRSLGYAMTDTGTILGYFGLVTGSCLCVHDVDVFRSELLYLDGYALVFYDLAVNRDSIRM